MTFPPAERLAAVQKLARPMNVLLFDRFAEEVPFNLFNLLDQRSPTGQSILARNYELCIVKCDVLQ